MFRGLYERVLRWSRHRHAPWYLGGLSFAESSFFPIPPDVMLAPMALARPQDAWRLAALTTVTSVLGGLLGYLIGAFAFDVIEPYLHQWGWWDGFVNAREQFDRWGFWFVLLAGFSPIPYKVFTISAGVAGMPILPFLLGSVIGRGGRFFLVAGLIRAGGEKMEEKLRQHVEWMGWAVVIIVVVIIIAWQWFQ